MKNGTSGDWYIKYTIQGTKTEKTSIQQKLEGRAKSVGLYKAAAQTEDDIYNKSSEYVYMFVR